MRDHQIQRLLYTSSSSIAAEELNDVLRSIIADAARRNSEKGITGALLYVDNTFIQAIEGPPAAIENLFESICCDLRHKDVRLIEVVETDRRLFEKWSMAYIDEANCVTLQGTVDAIKHEGAVSAAKALNKMLELLTAKSKEATAIAS